MKKWLSTAAVAAILSLAVSHMAFAQDRETNATKLFDVSEKIQRSGPCSDLPFLWLSNAKTIAFLDALLSGAYDDAGSKLPEYIACFEHQRAVVNLRTVIHAGFPETEAAFRVAEVGYFTDADIDEFIWLLRGTVKTAATQRSEASLNGAVAASPRQIRPGTGATEATNTDIGGNRDKAIGTGEQVAALENFGSAQIPRHKPPMSSRPSAEAVSALLEDLEKEIQDSATPIPIGASASPLSLRQRRSTSGPNSRVQLQVRKATALAERARRIREGRGSSMIGTRRSSIAPPSPTNQRARLLEPLVVSQVEALRLQFQACWVPPEALRDALDLVVKIRFGLLPDGSLRSEPTVVEQSRMRSRDFRAAAEAAQQAVQDCTPLDELPEASYEQWRDLELAFDPRDLPG